MTDQNQPCLALSIDTPVATASFYKMQTVTTTTPSYTGARAGDYYDPLVPTKQICAGDRVWMDLSIPSSAEPGTHPLPYGLTLTVWKMTIPVRPSMPMYLGLNGYVTMLAHGFPSDSSLSVQGPLTQTYVNAFRAHRIEPYGQNTTIYPAMASDGVSLDLDKYSSFGASFRQLVLNGAIAPPILYYQNIDVAPTPAMLQAIDADIVNGSIEPGSMGYVWDEGEGDPNATAKALERAQLAKTYAPHMRVMTTRAPDPRFEPYVDIFYPIQNEYNPAWTVPFGLYVSCVSQGSCTNGVQGTPSGPPMMLIDAPSISPRAFMWINYVVGAQGSFYYSGTQMIQSAWTNQYLSGGNGDGTMVYPDRNAVIPDVSIRMKMLRQGSYDIEYLKWAKAAGISFTSPASDPTHWSRSFEDYQQLRTALGSQLNLLR
jgi:hypothetical protein